MRTEQLEIFAAVIRHGSFTAAANARGADPSSVSRAVAALEAELGFRLFDRTTRRFAPTEAGRLYYAEVAHRHRGTEIRGDARAGRRCRARGSDPRHVVRRIRQRGVGPEPAGPARTLPRARARARPERRAARSAPRADRRRRPARSAARRAISSARACCPCITTFARPRTTCGGAESITTPGDLSRRDCVRFPFAGFSEQWRFPQFGRPRRRRARGRVVARVERARAETVRARRSRSGAARGLDDLARELETGELVRVLPELDVTATVFDTAAWILYPDSGYVTAAVRAFIEHLHATFRD